MRGKKLTITLAVIVVVAVIVSLVAPVERAYSLASIRGAQRPSKCAFSED